MPEKRKLIEVAVPLDAINQGSIEDKNRKTGHIRNLHKWFAPMPLPAWRSMLFAALVDDPGDSDEVEKGSERERLIGIAERLARFDSYKDRELLQQAREEIHRSIGTNPITVVDPFCGGGSTIVEAQRLGLNCLASDLNPLPVLITTAICRIPALFGGRPAIHDRSPSTPIGGWKGTEGLLSDVRGYAQIVRERAWARLAQYYPDHNGARPVAYRWAWSVRSPNPAAKGALTPLVTDWWLSKRKGASAYIAADAAGLAVTYSIETKGSAAKGTTSRNGARCLLGGTTIPLDYIRAEGRAGRLEPTLIALVTRSDGATAFHSPCGDQINTANGCPEPDFDGIDMPPVALGFRVQQYGMVNFASLFTRRQRLSLSVFADEVRNVRADIQRRALDCGFADDDVPLEQGGKGARAYADAVTTILGLCVGKLAQSNNILVRWFIDPRNGSGKATPSFDRHAIPMVWDFVETNPFGGSVGDWTGPVLETALRAFELCVTDGPPATVIQSDARTINKHIGAGGALIATDPPYYANIGYADLSDFFYQWLRPALRDA